MKRKKTIIGIVIGGLCCLGLCSILVLRNIDFAKADSPTVIPKTGDELFPEKEIPAEYEEDNLYVQMNNKLVKAMNDYEAGTISKEEYTAICDEISKVVNDENNQKKMKKEENEFKEEVGKR